MRCLLLMLVIFVQACCADKVHVKLTVTSPTGPVADVQFVAQGRCAERGVPSPLVFATTNVNGVAELDITRCSDPWIKLYAVPRDADLANPGSRPYDLELKRINDLGLNYSTWTKLSENQTLLEIEFSAPGGVTVTLRPQGEFRKDVPSEWHSPDNKAAIVSRVNAAGTMKIEGVRKGVTGRYFVAVSQRAVRGDKSSQVSRFVPADLTNLEQDIDIGVLAIPSPPSAALLDITQTTQLEIPEVQPGYVTSAVTLISTDAQTILTYPVPVTNPQTPPYIGHAVLPVPAGTFYVVPSGFTRGGAYGRVLARIASGEDLTNSGIPKFTVAEGQTATVNYTWMDAWRAIFQLPPQPEEFVPPKVIR